MNFTVTKLTSLIHKKRVFFSNRSLNVIFETTILNKNEITKTEPPVNGENLDEAATVIQASFKGHQERKETGF